VVLETLKLVLFLLMCLALLAVLVSFYTAWMLTHPPRRTYAGQVARGRPGVPDELVPARVYRPFGFTAETLRGETLPGWIIAGDAPAGPRVIITHGWSNSKHGALTRVPAVAREASEVVLWDMRGGGEAPGWCALGAVEHKDLLALLAAMPDDRPTVLYGWSMGAGVALSAAASDDPRSELRLNDIVRWACLLVQGQVLERAQLVLELGDDLPVLMGYSGPLSQVVTNLLANALQSVPPGAPEQHRIVAKVDEMMALCDQLKESLVNAQATKLKLSDSLVQHAVNVDIATYE